MLKNSDFSSDRLLSAPTCSYMYLTYLYKATEAYAKRFSPEVASFSTPWVLSVSEGTKAHHAESISSVSSGTINGAFCIHEPLLMVPDWRNSKREKKRIDIMDHWMMTFPIKSPIQKLYRHFEQFYLSPISRSLMMNAFQCHLSVIQRN